MKNSNETTKSARHLVGVIVMVLASLAFGQLTGHNTLICILKGEGLTYKLGVDPIFTITAIPITNWSTGGGKQNFGTTGEVKNYACDFDNLSAPWSGKIKVIGEGYTVKLDSIQVIPSNLRGRVAFSNDILRDSSMINKKINLYFTAIKITIIKETARVIPVLKENDRPMFFNLSGRKISSTRVSALTVSKNQTRLIGLFGKR
jgi:hypothetical protein